MFKKTISILLAVLMLASVLSVTASALIMQEPDAAGALGDNGSWKFYEDDGELYIYANGEMADTYTAFRKDYGNKIKSVYITSGVTSVSTGAFMNCLNLESVELGMSSVTEIGTNAFYGCSSLSSVTFPDKLVTIGDAAFMGAAFKTAELPETIASIGSKSLGYQNTTTKVTDFEIEGYGDTVAYTYAQSNGFKFTQSDSVEAIESIALSFTEPKAGANPSAKITVPDTVECESFTWVDAQTGSTLSSSDTFEDGKSYYTEIYLKAKSGYCFAVDTNDRPTIQALTVNGESKLQNALVTDITDCNPAKYAAIKVPYSILADPELIGVTVTWDFNGATASDTSMWSPEMLKQYNETGTVSYSAIKGYPGKLTSYKDMGVVPPEGKEFDHYEVNGLEVAENYTFTYDKDTTIKLIWKSSSAPYPKTLNLTSGKLKLSYSDFSDVRNCFRYAEMFDEIAMVGSAYDIDKNGKADVVLEAAEVGGPFVKRAPTCNLKGKYTFKISNYEYSSLTVNFGTPKISAATASLNAGGKKTLTVTGASVTKWTTSSKAVATVTNGKVTALKKGTATITAKLATGDKLTCKVTVNTNPKLSKSSVSVKVKKTVTVKITGKAATVNNVYTNTKIAKITSKNTATTIVVKGLKNGTTTLKVKVNGVVLKLKVKVK